MTPTAQELAGYPRDPNLGWLALPGDARIRLAALPYLCGGWSYPASQTQAVHVAHAAPGLPAGLTVARTAGERVINCTTLTASVLLAALPAHPRQPGWGAREYAELQVFRELLPALDTPIRAVERVRGTRRVDPAQRLAPGWYLFQGWWAPLPVPKGHGFLVYVGPDGSWTKLESTNRDGLVGPRWRATTQAALTAQYTVALFAAPLGC